MIGPPDPAEQSKSVELVRAGSEIAGAAVGGAVGLIGGPPGAIGDAVVGVAATRILKRVGAELHDRVLGPRQRIRAGAALAFAADEVNERLAAQESPRADGFLDALGDRRHQPTSCSRASS